MSETAIKALERITRMDCATGIELLPDQNAWIMGQPARVTTTVDVRRVARDALAELKRESNAATKPAETQANTDT